MPQVPDNMCCRLGAEAIRRQVSAFGRQVRGTRRGDAEAIHDTRVASRRLRSTLELFEPCWGAKARTWRKAVRRVTRALGSARDLDVQIGFLRGFLAGLAQRHRPGVERLLLRLAQRRRSAQRQVVKALTRLRASGVLRRIDRAMRRVTRGPSCPPAGAFGQARRVISARLRDMLAYEVYLPCPRRVAELHRMRIAAKRLRYTAEVFAGLFDGELDRYVEAARDVQTRLGEIHDCDVWVLFLGDFLRAEQARTAGPAAKGLLAGGIEHLRRRLRLRRRELHRAFLTFWRMIRKERLWQGLRGVLRRRLDDPSAGLAAGRAGALREAVV